MHECQKFDFPGSPLETRDSMQRCSAVSRVRAKLSQATTALAFSVISPVYNARTFLVLAIESILPQKGCWSERSHSSPGLGAECWPSGNGWCIRPIPQRPPGRCRPSRHALVHLLHQYRSRQDKAGTLARTLDRELGALWACVVELDVEPTNHRAKRARGFAAS
jgi:hypothetical protein